MNSPRKRNKLVSFPVLLGALSLLAFVVRLQVCRELLAADPNVATPSKYTDMATYKSSSEEIVDGVFTGEYYYQPFYYAVFLPTIKKLFGFGAWPVMLAQCCLSALTVWFTGRAARSIRGTRAGIAAGLLLSLSSA